MEPNRKLVLIYLFNSLILIGFVALIEYYLGWAHLLSPWLMLSPATILLAVLLILITYILRAIRVYDYFYFNVKGNFLLCLRLSLQHNLLNNLLPMRTGEVGFPVLMARYFSISASRSIPVLLWFRILDFHTLVLLGLPMVIISSLGLQATTFITLIWLISPWLFFKYYIRHANTFAQQPGRLSGFIHKIIQGLPQDGKKFIRSWLWTVSNWILKLSVFAWILGLFVVSDYIASWFGAAMGDITSVLPIHGFAGIGTYEAGVVAGLTPFKVAPEEAIQAAVNLHLFVLGCTLISGIISILIPGNQQKHVQQDSCS